MKKLLTTDHNLIKKVENVLTAKKVQSVTYEPDKVHKIIAVLNRDGKSLYEAVKETAGNSKYYLGVLRKHPEYATPKELIALLNKQQQV